MKNKRCFRSLSTRTPLIHAINTHRYININCSTQYMRMKNLLLKNVFSRYNVSVPSSIQLFFITVQKLHFYKLPSLLI